jgi:Mrp family chromosome partitioning ATPase/predicted Fe-Mo cluster-binding NifX family protein
MSEACSGSCGSCEESCDSKEPSREDMLEPANAYSKIKKVIGVVSGKGGVGKSFVTSYISVLMNRKGYETAILDADVTGPSIPKAFGIHNKATGNEMGIVPEYSKEGTKIMSINLLLDADDTPVIWRGPIIAGTVKQFWSEVVWGDVDYMFVDMPPGTGDVPLTVFQSIPLDGIIVITSPQELVSMIVSKAVNMANAMNIPILGVIENYSYVSCGDCGKRINVFGESHVEEVASKYGLKVLAKIPIDPSIAKSIDNESVETLEGDWLDEAAAYLEKEYPVKANENTIFTGVNKKIAVATGEDEKVFQHFGQCKKFTIYEMVGDTLSKKYVIDIKGSGHSELSNILVEAKVNILICGGIGSGALDMLLKAGVIVIPGQDGDLDVVVEAYLDGSLLASNVSTCNHDEHSEGHHCGEDGHSCH